MDILDICLVNLYQSSWTFHKTDLKNVIYQNFLWNLYHFICDFVIDYVKKTFPDPIDRWALAEAQKVMEKYALKKKGVSAFPVEKIHQLLSKVFVDITCYVIWKFNVPSSMHVLYIISIIIYYHVLYILTVPHKYAVLVWDGQIH